MKPHKWAKEIKAWADGAEIEFRDVSGYGYISNWELVSDPNWLDEFTEFRIKPQPKKPQYLYVYQGAEDIWLSTQKLDVDNYIGKIKLETEE